jgi:hypothetical protein
MVTLITGLLGISSSLINTVGITPVFRVLFRLREIIRDNPSGVNVITRLYTLFDPARYNMFVVRQITDFIIPLWKDCLNPVPKRFNLIYWFFLTFLSFGLSGTLTKTIF